jgi:tellurium resistance protein TerD
MAINLTKGQTIDLRKNDRGEDVYDLSQVTIGLGWDVKETKSGFLGKLFGGKEEDYDLDAVAFLLDETGKIQNLGVDLKKGDIIFFNSLKHPSGQIWLTGDNRTGEGDGDDEQIIVRLNTLPEKYQKIIFLVTIYQGRQKNQHFGKVDNAFIRAVDAKGKEIAKFSLSGNESLNGKCSMIFSEVYRHNNNWKFRAIGDAKDTDSILDLLKLYTN